MSNPMDLTTEEGVRVFLADTPFACTEASPLSGGTANFVFRLVLVAPYLGKTTFVGKHAKPYVKSMTYVALDVNRQLYEAEALKAVKSWLPSDSVVTVPEVHFFDKEHNFMIIDDVGQDAVTLKAFMQECSPSTEIVSKIGDLVGEFLGKLHVWGRENRELCSFFEGNVQSKEISSWAFYGRLASTLNGKDALTKLSDPPLDIKAEDMKVIEDVVKDTTESILTAHGSFVMGDFWPGNLMVTLDKSGNLSHIFILDWEMARPGLLGIEVGQFCAEVHMLHRFNVQCKESAPILLGHFLNAYRKVTIPDEEFCRTAVIRLGTHMVTLAPRLPWGEKDLTRAVVGEGVSLIVNGRKGDLEWVRQSVVGSLIH